MITGEISEVGRHIRKASTRFMQDRDDRLMVDAGGNLSQLWSRAQELKREDGEPRPCIKYMQLYIDEHGCKGFPTINDWALIYDAEHFDYAREHLKETSRDSRLPVQQPAKREQDSLNEKFDSLIDVVKDVAKKQQVLTDTVAGCTLIAKFGISVITESLPRPTTVSDRTKAPPAFPHAFHTMGKPKRSHEPPKARKTRKNAS